MPLSVHMVQQNDLGLVLVALAVCVTGNWTCLELLARARPATIKLQAVWLPAAALVFGSSVWAMHFVAMLGMSVGTPVSYNAGLTGLSIAAAIGLSLPAMIAMLFRRALLAGLIFGLAISAMHYLGMAAMRGAIRMEWNIILVVLSIAVGVAFASMAMEGESQLRSPLNRVIGTLLLTSSVVCMHYSGMAAVQFRPRVGVFSGGPEFPPTALAITTIAITMMIVFVGLTSAYLDHYLERRRTDERTRLRAHILKLEDAKKELNLALASSQAAKLEVAVALESAYAANKSKSAFLAAMSHELRTPLNAVIGFAELMCAEAYGPLGNVHYKSYSNDIRKAGAHLLSLINDILDISRLEAQKAELTESVIVLPVLLEECLELTATQAAKADVALSLEVQPNLPSIKGDDRRIKQIVLNLLSNGIKFTPGGGRVTLRALVIENSLELEVEDTGIGISKEDLPKAFESFGQIDSRLSRKYEGSGLALPLALHLAQLHGATLLIQSEVECGTRVKLRFPRERTIVEELPSQMSIDLLSA